jgi:nucleoside-diphosphate-sugar epimerase
MVPDRLLIVGGTGFIGRNLALKAAKQGYSTTVLSLNTPAVLKVEEVEYLQADITDLSELQKKLTGLKYEYVVNLSGYIDHCFFLEGGRSVIDAHFVGVQNLLQVIDWDELRRFVQIGSSDEYGNLSAPQNEKMREEPISPYSLGKLACTQFLQMLYRTEKLPTVTLRLFLVYGPGQDYNRFLPHIIKGCLSNTIFPTSAGEQLRDFCYIDDITDGIMKALMNDSVNGEVINLASGSPIAIRDVVEKVQKVVGHGFPEYGKIPYRIGENMALYANISKAIEVLGCNSLIAIDQGILKTVDYYREKEV